MFRHKGPISSNLMTVPRRPENYSALEQDDKDMTNSPLRNEALHEYYFGLIHSGYSHHWNEL